MNTYTRLAFWEREEISRGCAQNMSNEEIALILKREPSTIGREIDRAGISKEEYRAEIAQDLLNGRPRKVLGWKKPNEVFQELIALEI